MGTQANFFCPVTMDEFYISQYSIMCVDGRMKYSADGKELVNEESGELLVPVKKKGEYNIGIGRIAGMTPAARKEVLKKRSTRHNAHPHQKDKFHAINMGEMGKQSKR